MSEISSLEAIASDACTRSGAFALLLSLALASLIPTWSQRKKGKILGRYLAARLSLATIVDAFDENPIWKDYKLTHETESLSLEEVVSLEVSSATLPSFNKSPSAANQAPG